MYPPKPLFTKIVMSVLTAVLASGAFFGNGLILTVTARFKSLRTVPNILVANLALVDMLNAAINMPLHMIHVILEAPWFRGQILAIMTTFFNRLFIILNLASMLALMASMYFSIAFDLHYLEWKTNAKAVLFSFLIWFIGTVVVVLYSIPLLRIDLGDAHVIEYRAVIYEQGKHFIAVFIILFIIFSGILGFLTTRSIKRTKKKRAEMTLPALKSRSRLQNDIKATKTITISIAAYFLSYVPFFAYAIVGQQEETKANSWFAFFAWYAIFFSSAVNPIVYYLRSSRLRFVLKQFLKNPFGTSELKQKQSRDRGKGRGFDATGKGSDKQQRIDEIVTSKKYHGKRRNGMMILSIQALQAHLNVRELSEISGDGGENQLPKKRDKCSTSAETSSLMRLQIDVRATLAPNQQVERVRDRKEEKNNEVHEMSEKRKLENGTSKRRRARSRTKIHPLSTREISGVEGMENAVAFEDGKGGGS